METNVPLLPQRLEPVALPPAVNWPDDTEHLTWIYGLSDPRDGQLAIIGRSVQPERVVFMTLQHLRDGALRQPSPRDEWLADLACASRLPLTHLLACVPDEWAEDYKRLYVDAAHGMGAAVLTPRVPCYNVDGRTARAIQRGARWVLARAYPDLRSAALDSAEPRYDAETEARLRRAPLTPQQWTERKRRLEMATAPRPPLTARL